MGVQKAASCTCNESHFMSGRPVNTMWLPLHATSRCYLTQSLCGAGAHVRVRKMLLSTPHRLMVKFLFPSQPHRSDCGGSMAKSFSQVA
eukprot:2695119-Rhodomonas_salina.2